MKKVRHTIIWLALVGLIAACTLSGCKDKEEKPPAGTETSQTETADPNA